jgi:peptidoglycan/LPS O-acetylase OafA/YrhL
MLRQWKSSLDRWLIPPSSGVHLDMADGLRGLAILMVVMSHGIYFNPNGPKIYETISGLARMGILGVPIFFVLSGFLLSLPFFRGRQKNPFFWYHEGFASRRVLKIFPPFYAVILLLVLINYLLYHDPMYFKLGFAWATGIAHFVWFEKPLNGSFWSLWVEIGFYVILPFLFLASSGRNVKTTGWMIFAFLILLSGLSRLLFWHGAADEPMRWHFITSRFPSSLDFFAWGVLFGAFYMATPQDIERHRHLGLLGYLGLAIMVCTGFLFFWFERSGQPGVAPSRLNVEVRHLLPGLGAFLLLFFVFDTGCVAARFFASPIMRFLGLVSYEWFLIHQPAQHFFRMWTTGSHGSFIRYVFIVTLPPLFSLGLAVLLYHTFSLPIMKWGRSKLPANQRSRKPSLDPQAAA